MTLNGVMTVTLRYLTEFGKHAFQHITASICGGIYARVYCVLYFVVRVRYRRKESSCSLSHLLMSFLFATVGMLLCGSNSFFTAASVHHQITTELV